MNQHAVELTLAEREHDPYPAFAMLQREHPVAFIPALDMWLVTRWDDVAFVCEHPQLFRAKTEPSWLRDCLGENMLTLDGAAHDRLADGMRPPFVASSACAAVRDGLPTMYDELIDAFADDAGPVDLLAAYAEPLANLSLAAALQWTVDWRDLARWCRGVCLGIANFENDPEKAEIAAVAHRELGDAIDAAIGRGEFSGYEDAGFSREEIAGNVRLMVSGGINEPRDGVALVMWVLLQRPDLLAAVRGDRAMLRKVIEETFRWIPEGALVAACLGAANRDPARWHNPHEFRTDRREGSHLAFSLGEHRCLGEWLGRQQVRVGVERLLDRFPSISLAADVEIRGFEFRGPLSLPVVLR
jgi:cytochrome P450